MSRERHLLMETVHGSTLYNLNHPESDYDLYRVWSGKGRMRQNIGDKDVTNKSFDQFLKECGRGVPGALEALWSPVKTVDKLYFLNVVPGYSETVNRYLRTIKSFWMSGDLKKRRHSARLYLNLQDYMTCGKFNPRLSNEQVATVNWFAAESFYCPQL